MTAPRTSLAGLQSIYSDRFAMHRLKDRMASLTPVCLNFYYIISFNYTFYKTETMLQPTTWAAQLPTKLAAM